VSGSPRSSTRAPERIGDLNSRRGSAVAHLEGLRRERRRLEARIKLAERSFRDIDDELQVRFNNRLLGLPERAARGNRRRPIASGPSVVRLRRRAIA
jgi:hypothetical protein